MRSVATSVGIATITPYFIKLKKPYLISYFFRIDSHIIPAKAPIGVKNAPIFDPIIVLNKAFKLPLGIIDEYKTLIGMLLIKLHIKVDEIP